MTDRVREELCTSDRVPAGMATGDGVRVELRRGDGVRAGLCTGARVRPGRVHRRWAGGARKRRNPKLRLPVRALGPLALGCACALLSSVARPSAAAAYTCTRAVVNEVPGPSLVWNTRVIEWHVATNALSILRDETRAANLDELQRSFSAWENVPCSDIRLPYGGEVRDLKAGYSGEGGNQNAVVAVGSGWRHAKDAIAVTTTAYDPRTGIVVDADIEVNTQHFTFVKADSTCRRDSGFMDLRNTLTHEVGHVLGLDHPPMTRAYQDTTMLASAPACETKKQTLAEDDIEGLCAIYPAGAPTVPCFPIESAAFVIVDSDDGFGGCRATGRRGAGSAFGGLLASAALLAWRWRGRRSIRRPTA